MVAALVESEAEVLGSGVGVSETLAAAEEVPRLAHREQDGSATEGSAVPDEKTVTGLPEVPAPDGSAASESVAAQVPVVAA